MTLLTLWRLDYYLHYLYYSPCLTIACLPRYDHHTRHTPYHATPRRHAATPIETRFQASADEISMPKTIDDATRRFLK